jgi:hypothetical protein
MLTNPCGHLKGVTMLQLGKAKKESLGEEEAQNNLYHIFLFKVSIWIQCNMAYG